MIRTSLDDLLVTIDTLRAKCKKCIACIDTSPSDDFCSESCQRSWFQQVHDPRIAEVSGLIAEIMERQRQGLPWALSIAAPSRVM